MADILTDVIDTEQGSATGHFLPRPIQIATAAAATILTLVLAGGADAQGYRTGNSRAGRESLGTNCDFAVGANTQVDDISGMGYGFGVQGINSLNSRFYIGPNWRRARKLPKIRESNLRIRTDDIRMSTSIDRFSDCSDLNVFRLAHNYMLDKNVEFYVQLPDDDAYQRKVLPSAYVHYDSNTGMERGEDIRNTKIPSDMHGAGLIYRAQKGWLVAIYNTRSQKTYDAWLKGFKEYNGQNMSTRMMKVPFFTHVQTRYLEDNLDSLYRQIDTYIENLYKPVAEDYVNEAQAREADRPASNYGATHAAQAPAAEEQKPDLNQKIKESAERQARLRSK